MKNILLTTLLTALCSNLIFAQSAENSTVVRLNGIYVDEIADGDEGWGITVEPAYVFDQTEDLSQTIGFEIGYITSEEDESGIELETDLIPLLINYTASSDFDEGFIWEAGGGLGVYFVDADLTTSGFLPNNKRSDSDDDVVFGGQIFGRLGYQFSESLGLMVGVRYMLAEDADLFGIEDEVINSVAFDLSLKFAY